jgi:hypothetical protein
MKNKRFDDLQRWRMEQLSKYGGYSVRFIAAMIFDRSVDKVTPAQRARVASYLTRHELKLRDWRDGRLPQARAYADQALTGFKRGKRTA